MEYKKNIKNITLINLLQRLMIISLKSSLKRILSYSIRKGNNFIIKWQGKISLKTIVKIKLTKLLEWCAIDLMMKMKLNKILILIIEFQFKTRIKPLSLPISIIHHFNIIPMNHIAFQTHIIIIFNMFFRKLFIYILHFYLV